MKIFSGFTLLEILIALFILTIVGMLISTGLSTIVKAKDQMDVSHKELINIQIAMTMIERDIRQMIHRPIPEGDRKTGNVVVSNNKIEFVHAGYMNPFALFQRSTLQRVRYEMEGSNLVRRIWRDLDGPLPGPSHHEVLLQNIKYFHIKMIPSNNPFVNPDLLNELRKQKNFNVGVEVEMESYKLGYVKRLIPISVNYFNKVMNVSGKAQE